MDLQLHKGGVKVGTGVVPVYINPDEQPESGIVILSSVNPSFTTAENRLIIEAPGEYEFQGVTIKGIRKKGSTSFTIDNGERQVYVAESLGIEAIPDDEMFDAVVLLVVDVLDDGALAKISYPVVLVQAGGEVAPAIEAETVKSLNLKKLSPEGKNIYLLQ